MPSSIRTLIEILSNLNSYEDEKILEDRRLLDAVREGQTEAVQALLANGLSRSQMNCELEVINLNGVSSTFPLSPLEVALFLEKTDIVSLFLNTPDSDLKLCYVLDALEWSVQSGRYDDYCVLSVHVPRPIFESCMDLLIIYACEGGNLKIVQDLLNNGADTNGLRFSDYLDTPLRVAVVYGKIDIVKLLVDSGIDIDYFDPHKDICEGALRLATLNQQWEIVQYLLPISKNKKDIRYAKRKLKEI